jgi:hypothetical protein
MGGVSCIYVVQVNEYEEQQVNWLIPERKETKSRKKTALESAHCKRVSQEEEEMLI